MLGFNVTFHSDDEEDEMEVLEENSSNPIITTQGRQDTEVVKSEANILIEQNISMGSSIKDSCERNAPSLNSFVHTGSVVVQTTPNLVKESPAEVIAPSIYVDDDEESEATSPAKEGVPCHIRQKTSYEFLPQKFSTPYLKSTREQFIKMKCHVLMHLPP